MRTELYPGTALSPQATLTNNLGAAVQVTTSGQTKTISLAYVRIYGVS